MTARDREQRTLLHLAAAKGHSKALKMMIEAGADVFACDEGQCTPAYWATYYSRTEAVKILIDAQADVNARNAEDVILYILLHYFWQALWVQFTQMHALSAAPPNKYVYNK